MQPIGKGALDAAVKKPGCLGPGLGAAGILLAVVTAPIGILSITSDPARGVVLLIVACLGAALFARAWLADRRWHEVERTTIHRHSAAGRTPGRYVGGRGMVGNPIGQALRSLLDDPVGLGSVAFEGPGTFHVRFALLPTDSKVLRGEAVAISRLDPRDRPGPDARLGLVALGWAALAPPNHEDFAAEWMLPVDLAELSNLILSTARIYGVDPSLVRPRFGATPTTEDRSVSGAPTPGGVLTVAALATPGPGAFLRRWWRRAVTLASVAGGLGILVAGRDGLRDVLRSLPQGLVSGAFGILILGTAVQFLTRYLRTADPFSATGWDWIRRRTRTTYAAHAWWGIFGAISAVIGIFFIILALKEAAG